MPFKPGQSGNPKGRTPNKKSFSDAARELLEAEKIDIKWSIDGKEQQVNIDSSNKIAYGLVAALIIEGLKGNDRAIKELIDRAEGKPVATNLIAADLNNDFSSLSREEKEEKLAKLLGKVE